MPKSKKQLITKKCMICNTTFEVYPSRQNTAKYCSKPCQLKGREIHSNWKQDIANTVKALHQSEHSPYGEESNYKNSESNKGRISWNARTATILECIQCGSEYKAIGKRKEYAKYCTMQCRVDYANQNKDESKAKYYSTVHKITEQQELHTLPNNEKRGKISRMENPYHLDHIIPIIYGYENNIAPEVIGDINNLQFIPAIENHKKHRKYEN